MVWLNGRLKVEDVEPSVLFCLTGIAVLDEIDCFGVKLKGLRWLG